MDYNQLIILCLLSVAIFQDFKFRAISLLLFPLLLVVLVLYGMTFVSIKEVFLFSVINIAFLLFQVAGVMLYLTIRNKQFTNPFSGYLGVGDLLFWIVISVSFSPVNFIGFSILSFLLILVLHFLLRNFPFYGSSQHIPLAGFQALFLSLTIIFNLFFSTYNTYNDHELLIAIGRI